MFSLAAALKQTLWIAAASGFLSCVHGVRSEHQPSQMAETRESTAESAPASTSIAASPAVDDPLPEASVSETGGLIFASAPPSQEPQPNPEPTGKVQSPARPAPDETPRNSVQGSAANASSAVDPAPSGPLRISRGEGNVPLILPRNETLIFDVTLDFGWLGEPGVGKVTITSRVEPYYANLLAASEPVEKRETAVIQARAEGRYAVYELDDTITASLLPQPWPSIIHRNLQTGSENRKRELMLGTQGGEFVATYRSDRHCRGCDDPNHFVQPDWAWQEAHHCKKCKRAEHRVWREIEKRKTPPGTLDMMSAVFLARSMLVERQERVDLELIDQLKLWNVALTRGKHKRCETPAGTFDAVEVLLNTSVPKGEKGRDAKDFEGLFGIHGTISIWMHPETGVPVLITGSVPAGPMDLDVRIALASFAGTPPEFMPGR